MTFDERETKAVKDKTTGISVNKAYPKYLCPKPGCTFAIDIRKQRPAQSKMEFLLAYSKMQLHNSSAMSEPFARISLQQNVLTTKKPCTEICPSL